MKSKSKLLIGTVLLIGSLGIFSYVTFKNPNVKTDPKSINLVVTQDQTQTIINALADRPYKETSDLIQSIIYQARQQLYPVNIPDTNAIKKDSTKTNKKK